VRWSEWASSSIAVVTLLMIPVAALAAYTNTSSVVDGAGSQSTGGSYGNVSAVAQPGAVGIARNGGLVNYSGFLNTISLRPALDTDGDGLIDEFDPDNDNDALEDAEEIGGNTFSPVTVTDVNDSDTDGDGALDGEESVAGTDPTDADALLTIIAVQEATNGVEITWLARSNRTYEVRWNTDLTNAGGFTSMDTVTVTDVASAPWYVVTNTYVDTVHSAATNGFYRVLVQP